MRNVDMSWDLSELRLPDRGDVGGAFDGARLPKKPPLTLEQIKEWVDVYRVANKGKFPSVGSGTVLNADGSETGESWKAIDSLFKSAAKGFPSRGLKECGFTSLADFLDQTYPDERKPRAQRVEKADLTLEQIKEWVDVYRVANEGKFPSADSGNVLNADGSETGENWSAIDALFRVAAKGSPARGLKECGFISLADFLDQTYPDERKPRAQRVEKADLTLEPIKEWIEVYRSANAGAFPSRESGNVLNADGSETGETWLGIDALFRSAAKGSSARGLKDCGFTSLADFLDQAYPEERAPRVEKVDVTPEQIKEWVDVYRSANEGRFPTLKSGKVLNADGSETGESWKTIDSLFKSAAKGFPARGLKGCGFTSLADFLDRTYPEERNPRAQRVEKAELTREQIKEWVDVYRVANEGKFPSEESGNVLNADGSETGETWVGISALFRTAAKGAPARGLKGCGFTSLADFLDKTYPEERKQERKIKYPDQDILLRMFE